MAGSEEEGREPSSSSSSSSSPGHPDRVYRLAWEVCHSAWPRWRRPTSKASPHGSHAGGPEGDYAALVGLAYALLQPRAPSPIAHLAHAEALLTSDLWLLKRLFYKNKNQVEYYLFIYYCTYENDNRKEIKNAVLVVAWGGQHAHAHYWRHLQHARKVITKLLALEPSRLHQRLPFSLPPSTSDPPPRSPSPSVYVCTGVCGVHVNPSLSTSHDLCSSHLRCWLH